MPPSAHDTSTAADQLDPTRLPAQPAAARPWVLLACLALAACATDPGGSRSGPGAGPAGAGGGDAASNLLYSSPECLARQLKPGDPFPASAIPPAAMAARQSGMVAIRYDVVDGVPQNLAIVASQPPGLYDAAALQHAGRYRDATRTTVKGCVMTIDVRF